MTFGVFSHDLPFCPIVFSSRLASQTSFSCSLASYFRLSFLRLPPAFHARLFLIVMPMSARHLGLLLSLNLYFLRRILLSYALRKRKTPSARLFPARYLPRFSKKSRHTKNFQKILCLSRLTALYFDTIIIYIYVDS